MAIENEQLASGGGGGAETGSVITYTADAVPDGYLLCDGATLNRVTYADLYAIIGDAYGSGDGATTFQIPDFRGKFLRGTDKATANDPDAGSRTASGTGGNTGDAVGSYQADGNKSHRHFSGATSTNSAWGRNGRAYVGFTWCVDGGSITGANSYDSYTTFEGNSDSRPKNINVNYMIKY